MSVRIVRKAPIRPDAQPASRGSGGLLQRDYWAVLRQCRYTPREVIHILRRRFCEFPPEEFARFSRTSDVDESLDVEDVLKVKIRMAGEVGVCVVHIDENSITLGTLKGHPEAGRITFGAYRNDRGDVIFHIRSRARSKSPLQLAGFMATGDAMQTHTWASFIDRFAHTVGDGVIGSIQAEERRVEDVEEDASMNTPTFVARGD